MDFDSSDTRSAHYSGKIKTQSFKEFQLERLIRGGKVVPASKLTEFREQELKRIKDFEEAAQEEQRQRRGISRSPPKDLNVPLTRERFEE